MTKKKFLHYTKSQKIFPSKELQFSLKCDIKNENDIFCYFFKFDRVLPHIQIDICSFGKAQETTDKDCIKFRFLCFYLKKYWVS